MQYFDYAFVFESWILVILVHFWSSSTLTKAELQIFKIWGLFDCKTNLSLFLYITNDYFKNCIAIRLFTYPLYRPWAFNQVIFFLIENFPGFGDKLNMGVVAGEYGKWIFIGPSRPAGIYQGCSMLMIGFIRRCKFGAKKKIMTPGKFITIEHEISNSCSWPQSWHLLMRKYLIMLNTFGTCMTLYSNSELFLNYFLHILV